MFTSVQIIEINSDNIIAEYPIELLGDDLYEDYFTKAWEKAVYNGLVAESARSDYSLQLVNEDPAISSENYSLN